MTQTVAERIEVEPFEKVIYGLGTHLGDELVGVGIFKELVAGRELVDKLEVLLLGQQVETLQLGRTFGTEGTGLMTM